MHDRDLSVLLGHWVFGQLPRVLLCVAVWLLGARWGLMPSLRRSLASGGSWRRVVVTGLVATTLLLVVTVGIGAAVVFAIGHEQSAMGLRVVIGVVTTVFAYPWVAARSLWAPWIAHTLVDVVGDSILQL